MLFYTFLYYFRNLKLVPVICPGATDVRYLRSQGIPCLGFSPMALTEIRIHGNDEYLNKDIFLKGIEIYCDIIKKLTNVDI